MTEKDLALAAGWIKNSQHAIALTGAGISVDSGIPDFRSPGGLWSKYNPMEYAAIETFRSDPAKVWTMLTEMIDVLTTAIPNAGHKALTDLESMGLLQGIVTQNIDNLHQFAGAKNVIEYHGNAFSFTCIMCGESYEAESFRSQYEQGVNWPPRCGKCNHYLKPDIIFFGEAIPPEAAKKSHDLALKSDLMLVVGTSAKVYPAAELPAITRANGGRVIEINKMQTRLTGNGADLSLLGSSTQILPRIVSMFSEQ